MPKLDKRLGLVLLLVVISIISLVILFSSLQPAPETPAKLKNQAQPKPGGDLLSKMVVKIPGTQPDAFWEIQLTKLENRNNVGSMNEVKGKYFVKNKVFYQLSAKTGNIHWQTGILKLNGAVNLVSSDNKNLTASEVTWDPNQKKIIAVGQVVLKTKQATVETDQMKSDLELNNLSFSGKTNASYKR